MYASVRPFVTAGVALVGASVIAVTPIAPPLADIHVANPAMRLTAAASELSGLIGAIAGVPANIPAREFQALQDLADALADNGSIWVFSEENLWGGAR